MALSEAVKAVARRTTMALMLAFAFSGAALALETVELAGCSPVELGARTLDVARVSAPDAATGADADTGASLEQLLRTTARAAEGARMNFGRADRVLLRFSILAGDCQARPYLELGNLFLNRARLFRLAPDGGWVLESRYPVEAEGIPERLRRALLPLSPERGMPTSFIVEVVGRPSTIVLAPRIVTASTALVGDTRRATLSGLLSGAILSIAAYCMLLGAWSRFSGLVSFSIAAMGMGAFYAQMAGLLDPVLLRLFPGSEATIAGSERVTAALVLTAALFHWIFIRRLLGGPSAGTLGDRSMPPLLGFWALSMIAVPFVAHPMLPRISVAVAVVALLMVVREVMRAAWSGHPLAAVILAAFGSLALPVLGFIALVEGLAPGWAGLVTLLGVGTLTESILLAIAFGAQVRSLHGRHRRLAERTHELSLLSQLDALTGLGNRRAYDGTVPEELERCQRRGRLASLLVIDIDHFKQVNDTYGHEFGDSVIRVLGVTIANCVRATDRAYRYGGEEFVVLLPGLGAEVGREVGERIMREFTNLTPTAPDGTRPFFSVSIGLAQMRPGDDARARFARADSAMYRAKQNGRCRLENGDDSIADALGAARPQPTSAAANSSALKA
ncbi:MAG: GGDEF domain-containing protein [Burkholderiaceae bacterium]|nr:GGDEF domain-containing protein [Burkholderiaceae bacterium]